ncbi:FCD domain-containing protein [Roseibium sp.]|uniref:FCD domain-containing protein n=1 Tax=Roseibium sp. TaxID=1936156 RepID=UPI003A97C0BC
MFRKAPPIRTADAVVQQIEELILNGVLRPGDRLPPERELASEIDVSRPVLREALKLLEERGLLTSRQGGGTFVADVIGPIFSEPIIALIERHPTAIADYLEFRHDMEGTAAAHAAERATASDRKILTDVLAQMDAAYESGDAAREVELDVDLHHAVGEAAHNIILLHALRSCYRLLENGVFYNRQRLYHHPTARRAVLEQHKRIVDRILAGDPDGARQASHDHIDFVAAALKEAERAEGWQEVSDLRLKQRSHVPRSGRSTAAKG